MQEKEGGAIFIGCGVKRASSKEIGSAPVPKKLIVWDYVLHERWGFGVDPEHHS